MDFNLFSLEVSKAIGWALIHSVWQILLVAALLKSVLLIVLNGSPRFKFNIVFASLIAIVSGFVATFYIYFVKEQTIISQRIPDDFIIGSAINYTDKSLIELFKGYVDSNISVIVLLWTIGIALFISKIVLGFVYIERIKKNNTSIIDSSFIERFNRLSSKIGVQKCVKFLESASVRVPMVVGHIKPVLLIPAGMLAGMPYSHIEAIVAHELAHIYRKDFLVNIFVAVVESLFFFHPIVWWMTSILEDEREKCCDDIAVSVTSNKLLYAKALASVVEYSNAKPHLALSFSGNRQKLYSRISRLLKDTNMKTSVREKIIIPIAVLLVFTTLAFANNTNKPDFNALQEVTEVNVDTIIKDNNEKKDSVEVVVNATVNNDDKSKTKNTKTYSYTVDVKDGKSKVTSSSSSSSNNVDCSGVTSKIVERDGSFEAYVKKGVRWSIRKKIDGKKYYCSIVDFKVTELEIDGKKIAETDFGKYSDIIKEIEKSARESTKDLEETKIDLKRMDEDLSDLDEEMSVIKVNLVDIDEDIDIDVRDLNNHKKAKLINKVDLKEIKEELQKIKDEAKLKGKLTEIDVEKILASVEKALEFVDIKSDNLEDIDYKIHTLKSLEDEDIDVSFNLFDKEKGFTVTVKNKDEESVKNRQKRSKRQERK